VSDFQTISDEAMAALRSVDTPTICNVIERFGVRPATAGYTDARIRACYPKLPPMVGYALTSTFSAAEPPREGINYAGIRPQMAALAAMPKPAVLVYQDLDDPPVAANLGEVMCTAYKTFGAVGLITSGAARDLSEIERLEFPVFASGTICSHGYPCIRSINVPVRVGGLTVYAGDLIHGDRNGVTVIPTDIAEEVARACGAYYQAEAILLDYLRGNTAPSLDEFSQKLDASKAAIKAVGPGR